MAASVVSGASSEDRYCASQVQCQNVWACIESLGRFCGAHTGRGEEPTIEP